MLFGFCAVCVWKIELNRCKALVFLSNNFTFHLNKLNRVSIDWLDFFFIVETFKHINHTSLHARLLSNSNFGIELSVECFFPFFIWEEIEAFVAFSHVYDLFLCLFFYRLYSWCRTVRKQFICLIKLMIRRNVCVHNLPF